MRHKNGGARLAGRAGKDGIRGGKAYTSRVSSKPLSKQGG
jgi:hypothetical protein